MARSGFKIAVGLAKSINRDIKRAERERGKLERQREMQALKDTRQQEMEERKEERDHERRRKLANKLKASKEKETLNTKVTEAKEAYVYRCEERKFIREKMINRELK